ncbi:hypothetical protein N7495_009840 [Penicillium taxi]|uniref:uncharacterized protein n=1 Tax=Penicillium taxi TaxID=168475 RepID=UPI00254586F1|nr:uncharacterized protein N7495_009840 [Penicillium taxi]KAJ5885330.1 hypothetical protein N7495_009840 [Penicillium taxi]
MGIPHLTKHLLPYGKTAVLSGNQNQELSHVSSVVIDGPSLVYYVYDRLLAWTNLEIDVLDIQPSCDEVSRGFVSYLLELAYLGVEIHQICFDGALPLSKRQTRLARVEKSRRRLESFRRRNPFSVRKYCKETVIWPTQIWKDQNLPSRRRIVPENPFMVSAVFEDLKFRWDRKTVQKEVPGTTVLFEKDYPWADITIMAPGEADVDCAQVARLKRSTVLTNDSDLLIHNLGPEGTVILLNSLQFIENTADISKSEIRGLILHPAELPSKLGIVNLQRFAYELTMNHFLGVSELIHRCKEDPDVKDEPAEYAEFLQEYLVSDDLPTTSPGFSSLSLDPRISELFWQFELPSVYCQTDDQPHVYLGIQYEDPTRRCAWEQGRSHRALGYSLFNLSRRVRSQFAAIKEFVRRGERIVAEQVTLSSSRKAYSDLDSLQKDINHAEMVFGSKQKPSFWILFALSEIYRESSNATTIPNALLLEHFLRYGHMGKKTEWADIQLMAQIQAVLYSLRILRQLLDVTDLDISQHYRLILKDLPPLHFLMTSRHMMSQYFLDINSTRSAVHALAKE